MGITLRLECTHVCHITRADILLRVHNEGHTLACDVDGLPQLKTPTVIQCIVRQVVMVCGGGRLSAGGHKVGPR
jgi:hypothetical protein